MGGPENLVDHVPRLGPGPSGYPAHRPLCLGPDTRFEPLTVFPQFFLLLSFSSHRQLFRSVTNPPNLGAPQVHLDHPLTN